MNYHSIEVQKKIFSLMLICVISVSVKAIEVKLKVDEFILNENKVVAFKEFLQNTRRFKANSDQDLIKNLEEDWILANAYYKLGLNDIEKEKIINLVNREMAKKYIYRLQNEAKVSDDIAKSYYLDNIENYKVMPIIDMKIFRFKSLDECDKFYQFTKSHTFVNVLDYVRDNNITVLPYKTRYNSMFPVYRNSIKDYKQIKYFTPPQFISGFFTVLYINDIIKSDKKYIPYSMIKQEIMKELNKKLYLQKRKSIIDKFRGKGE